ncbi:MAG: site-2 protease family protein [Clostridia bacterium]|nr:site-2 protease family protein [Clostridia bacterium]MBQ8503476.1 site-2 protease family protein [Clostridia bacterium]
MLFDIMRYISNGEYALMLVNLASIAFVVFCTLPVHEFAHAWTAVKLGDDTPRLQGRLTLRPMAHIDIMGALMILLVGFGYAKPVRVNMHNLKNGRKSFALVAIAGPLSNLVMALVFTFLQILIYVIAVKASLPIVVYTVLGSFFAFASSINISLAVFNLLPIPPLDGSRIANLILPSKYYFTIMKYERYIMIGMFVLLWTGILTKPLSLLSGLVSTGFEYICELPFRLAGLI